ncbi:Zn-dependent hydrolase, including glyoxylase [Acetobacter malorum]|nr:Zn-dependent hydrolase, including glyoxylase [Acetobacter malorum]
MTDAPIAAATAQILNAERSPAQKPVVKTFF